MVSKKSVEKQLKKIKFNIHGWGRTEAGELHNILIEGEEIYEVANGLYEGGFAMLVATDVRLLLVDKKPLNFLTVEDMRFDMINELDYNHRLLGAHISISAGNKNLKFTSYNQPRLRKLITHVQHCMADAKKKNQSHQVDQKQHLEQINQQLQAYLLAQHQHQQQLHEQLLKQTSGSGASTQQEAMPQPPEPIKPSPELSDYLFAQSLLAEYKANQAKKIDAPEGEVVPKIEAHATITPETAPPTPTQPHGPGAQTATEAKANPQMADLYAEGMQEIFGRRNKQQAEQQAAAPEPTAQIDQPVAAQTLPLRGSASFMPLEINALKIAYSKLPMALRNRRFGRPSFHSHSQQQPTVTWPLAK